MKRLTEHDLQRLALTKGVAITRESGEVINPTRQRLELEPPSVDAPVATLPSEAPIAPIESVQMEVVAQAVRENGETTAMLIASLIREIRAQQSVSATTPITRWDFGIQRDQEKWLIGITAIATRN